MLLCSRLLFRMGSYVKILIVQRAFVVRPYVTTVGLVPCTGGFRRRALLVTFHVFVSLKMRPSNLHRWRSRRHGDGLVKAQTHGSVPVCLARSRNGFFGVHCRINVVSFTCESSSLFVKVSPIRHVDGFGIHFPGLFAVAAPYFQMSRESRLGSR